MPLVNVFVSYFEVGSTAAPPPIDLWLQLFPPDQSIFCSFYKKKKRNDTFLLSVYSTESFDSIGFCIILDIKECTWIVFDTIQQRIIFYSFFSLCIVRFRPLYRCAAWFTQGNTLKPGCFQNGASLVVKKLCPGLGINDTIVGQWINWNMQ